MPRKRDKEGKAREAEISGVESKPVVHAKKHHGKKEVDVDEWLEKNVDELVTSLGLDSLGLDRDEFVEVLRRPVEVLFGSPTSRPDVETMVKRFKRYSDGVYPLIAQSILTLRDSLSSEQLDFVANNIGRSILSAAPRIYRETTRLGREELLPQLRSLWRTVWLELRSRTLPIECPVCHFNSLVKDMYCLVCGSAVDEKTLKRSIRFTTLLGEFLSSCSCNELERLLRYDYVLVNHNGIKHPDDLREEGIDVEVMLDKDDKELIRSAYSSLCRS